MDSKYYTIVGGTGEIKVGKEKKLPDSPCVGEQIEDCRKLEMYSVWRGAATGD